MHALTILSAGRDSALLNVRNQVMEAHGYRVISAETSLDLLEKFFEGNFDLVVLCHSIPSEEKKRVATLVRHHSPGTPILVLTDRLAQRFDFGNMTVENNPDALLLAIPEVVATHRPHIR